MFAHTLVTVLVLSGLAVSVSMAPRRKLDAHVFEHRYGTLVRDKYKEYRTARTLKKALRRRVPRIVVTDGVLKHWFRLYVNAAPPTEGNGICAQCGRRGVSDRGDNAPAQLLGALPGGHLVSSSIPTRHDAPRWACMIRRRLSLLQRIIKVSEDEKAALVSKLYDAPAPEAQAPLSRRWAAGILNASL